jgi:hypothetical protein
MARNSISGAIDGRPIPEYSVAKSPDSIARAVSVSARIARSGWSSRIRCSRSTYENSSPDRLSDPRIVPLDQHPLIERIMPRPTMPPTSSTAAKVELSASQIDDNNTQYY